MRTRFVLFYMDKSTIDFIIDDLSEADGIRDALNNNNYNVVTVKYTGDNGTLNLHKQHLKYFTTERI